MTNSSLRYALETAVMLAAAVLCGCGPKDGKKELEAGLRAVGAHDYAKAQKLLARCLELSPKNADACVALARVKLEGVGDVAAAAELIGRAAELFPDDEEVVALAAEIAWHGKDYAKAAAGFRRLALKAASAESRSLGWTGLGIVTMTQQDRDRARLCFLRAIRLDRRNASARYHLGVLYRDYFSYPEAALEQFEFFVRLRQVADTRVQKVQRTVIPSIQKTIAATAASIPGADRRDCAAAAAALAKVEEAKRKKNVKQEVAAYEKAVAADALSYPAVFGYATLLESSPAAVKDAVTRTMEAYRKACVLRPGSVKTLIAAGTFAARQGRHVTAVGIFSRAVAADPSNITAIDGLIRALARSGKKDLADAYQDYRDEVAPRKRK